VFPWALGHSIAQGAAAWRSVAAEFPECATCHATHALHGAWWIWVF